LSPIACWTWWWPPSRPKHVVQLTPLLQITTCCILTSLHCTFKYLCKFSLSLSLKHTCMRVHTQTHTNKLISTKGRIKIYIQPEGTLTHSYNTQ